MKKKIVVLTLAFLFLAQAPLYSRGHRGYSTKSYSPKTYTTKSYGLKGTGSNYSFTHVKGYYKKNGTYVKPYYRSKANKTQLDNWSTKGNVNPITGKKGTKLADH